MKGERVELNESRMLGQNNKCGDESEEWKEDADVRGHVRFINVTVAHDFFSFFLSFFFFFFFFFFFSTFKSPNKKRCAGPRMCRRPVSVFILPLGLCHVVSWCAPCGLPPSAPAASHALKVWKSHISLRFLHRAHSAGHIYFFRSAHDLLF